MLSLGFVLFRFALLFFSSFLAHKWQQNKEEDKRIAFLSVSDLEHNFFQTLSGEQKQCRTKILSRHIIGEGGDIGELNRVVR